MRKTNAWALVSATLAALLVTFGTGEVAAVTIDWSPVGNPGNAAHPSTHFGAVAYNYSIGKYDVTNAQYTEFLNAKAASDPLQLYSPLRPTDGKSGITQNGVTGSFTYMIKPGTANWPVNDVTWYDAIRFTNWLNNGQGNGDTETGAYTLTGGTPVPANWSNITRNPGATVFLPSEDEWYKAAYYNPVDASYFTYPGSNSIPLASPPPGGPNSANYNWGTGFPSGGLTDVGAYTSTTTPYGAFDMAGNVLQWNEAYFQELSGGFGGGFLGNGVRGCTYYEDLTTLYYFTRRSFPPNWESSTVGFRLVSIPEPSTVVLAAFGFAGIAVSGWRRRKRSY